MIDFTKNPRARFDSQGFLPFGKTYRLLRAIWATPSNVIEPKLLLPEHTNITLINSSFYTEIVPPPGVFTVIGHKTVSYLFTRKHGHRREPVKTVTESCVIISYNGKTYLSECGQMTHRIEEVMDIYSDEEV